MEKQIRAVHIRSEWQPDADSARGTVKIHLRTARGYQAEAKTTGDVLHSYHPGERRKCLQER